MKKTEFRKLIIEFHFSDDVTENDFGRVKTPPSDGNDSKGNKHGINDMRVWDVAVWKLPELLAERDL